MLERAQFQEAAVEHIVARLKDRTTKASRRMLLADEVGLGKTVVARGVIERLLKGRRAPLTVVYLCSNSEIAEQNRVKLDPSSGTPVGRVTELALVARTLDAELNLYSFTPGTSLRDGTGLEWERRLLMYLLHRTFGFPVWKRAWREFFRCGVRPDRWKEQTSRGAFKESFERKTSKALRTQLAAKWRSQRVDDKPTRTAIAEAVAQFRPTDAESRASRNRLIARLRGVMQRATLECLEPDLLILDEVQRFRDVLKDAGNPTQIASVLFARGTPVLILSATPYRALTLGHELADGVSSHHEDFFETLGFLYGKDADAPQRIRHNLEAFGSRLRNHTAADAQDPVLLSLKHELESDLRKVMCRTERNWYVLDRRKGVDDTAGQSSDMPGRLELEEYFRLHRELSPLQAAGQVTEFWKCTPSLLTFMDARYALFRKMRDEQVKVPRALLTTASGVGALSERNHRISKAARIALGSDERLPCLWTAPTYPYYRTDLFGDAPPRKLLVFSGWRFVPKAIAVILSQIAAGRMGGLQDASTQPLRFSDRISFHTFDVCFPSKVLSEIGDEAYRHVLHGDSSATAADVQAAAKERLLRHLATSQVEVVPRGGDAVWRVAMRLEARARGRAALEGTLKAWASEASTDYGVDVVAQHRDRLAEWLDDEHTPLRVSEEHLDRLALIAAFSPATCLVRALRSVFRDADLDELLAETAKVTLGALRRYFNRPQVQQILRRHRSPLASGAAADEQGFTERVLAYAADGQFQAVIDEYVYLLRVATQAATPRGAVEKLAAVWGLPRGNPRTNGPKGVGARVPIAPDAEVHSTHFAMAFGDEATNEAPLDNEAREQKQRKSVLREAFNSPFWPFVLATTSVGQEGLDFHLYCRDIMHWNLPSNPVDLEQREGRINRRDCLAIRQSIASDWPLESDVTWGPRRGQVRNPWTVVFDSIRECDDAQNYKHGLFPHWVYECQNTKATIRIKRHVPYFATSRDAERYERLKTGLALYRLVFGQANQEDLLQDLQSQLQSRPETERDRFFRRLSGYMLNLSPMGHEQAVAHAREEARQLLSAHPARDGIVRLLAAVEHLRASRADELSVVDQELDSLLAIARAFISGERRRSAQVESAVAALAYLRNPYDRIFDEHGEGGLSDDIQVIRETHVELTRMGQYRADSTAASLGASGVSGVTMMLEQPTQRRPQYSAAPFRLQGGGPKPDDPQAGQ